LPQKLLIKYHEGEAITPLFSLLGYGHIAPKTPIAKIVTIFYAILGIPLTVLCWSNIGDAMANAFRYKTYLTITMSKHSVKSFLNAQQV
jgi:hypothetical protein